MRTLFICSYAAGHSEWTERCTIDYGVVYSLPAAWAATASGRATIVEDEFDKLTAMPALRC